MNTKTEARNVYQIVTERIIEQLKKGTVPWQQSWTKAGLPRNLVSRRPYKNLNWLLLSMLGYEQNLFLTYKQASDIGAKVRKGEKANLVVFWKKLKPKEGAEPEDPKPKFVLRYYLLFNISQCENIPEKYIVPLPNPEPQPIERCAEIIKFMPGRPDIVHEKHKAYYHIEKDIINMPRMETFDSNEAYYETLFHELVHSTGHKSRLDRKSLNKNDMFSYSIEELTAEIGACFLLYQAGISDFKFQNNASYIDSWLKKLEGDQKYIFHASSQAQKAVDFILDIIEEEQQPEQVETVISQGVPVTDDLDDLPF